eukprot:803167-Pelagomonas_calceolata.AAC.2
MPYASSTRKQGTRKMHSVCMHARLGAHSTCPSVFPSQSGNPSRQPVCLHANMQDCVRTHCAYQHAGQCAHSSWVYQHA